MAIILDGTTGLNTPGVTDTGNLSVTGTSTLTGGISGGAVNLATNVTGTLPIANGGTGAATLAGANIAVVNVANTFTAAQELSTGTAIASAATINLNTATGNRVHITGTTAITAVTLTHGPRTVIFDGVLTLTHNATTNNLPGAANITTAAGDRAIYESDGTTVYCVSYIKASGVAVVAASSAVSYPQSIKSANYTLVLADAGYQIFHPSSDTTPRTFTIPANASVAFPIGTVLVFANEGGAGTLTVAITSDTLVNSTGITGSKTVPRNNILTCIKVTATKWSCFLGAQSTDITTMVAVANDTTPFITAYAWSTAGFGNKYTDPGTLPTGAATGVTFSPSGNAIAVAHNTSPFISVYGWSVSGFGAKFTNPATLPAGIGNGVAFSPAGTEIAVAHNTSPFISAYPWSSTGFGTKYTNPATLPTGNGQAVAFSPSGNAIAVAHDTTPFISVYPWSSGVFGTKFSNPATLPNGSGLCVGFSPAGTEIVVGHDSTPFYSGYPWSGAGFGTKFADPATLVTGIGHGLAFSPAGTSIGVAGTTTVSAPLGGYPWSASGFGTKFSNPSPGPGGGIGRDVAFSPAGTEVAFVQDTSTLSAYAFSSSGFGTKFANPGTMPTGNGYGVAFANM